jgi:5-methylcytosine-specific restriction protein A
MKGLLNDLRKKVVGRGSRPSNGKRSKEEFKRGCEEIKAYAKKRANGKCEHCLEDAPFLNEEGEPFLEVHHIIRLADEGLDLPENVTAICPNCHRRAHYGQNILDFRDALMELVRALEEKIQMVTAG